MKHKKHVIHLQHVNLSGWSVNISMHDMTGKFCIVMFHNASQDLLVKYVEEEEDVIELLHNQIEKTNGPNKTTNS